MTIKVIVNIGLFRNVSKSQLQGEVDKVKKKNICSKFLQGVARQTSVVSPATGGGALGNAPILDSALLFITRDASVGDTECFEMTLYVDCPMIAVS